MAKHNAKSNPDEKTPVDLVPLLKNVLRLELDDEDAAKTYPILFQLMAPRYKDGRLTRQEGALKLTVRSGRWHLTLECPSERAKCTYSVARLDSLFKSFEEALASSGVIWEETYKKRQKDLSALDRRI